MKKNKKLKGMTLVECITALAVLAVFTSAVATAAAALSKTKITTNNVIKQTSYQAPYLDNRNTSASDMELENAQIVVSVGSESKTYYADRYAVKVDDDPDEVASQDKSIYDGSNRRLKFYTNISDKAD